MTILHKFVVSGRVVELYLYQIPLSLEKKPKTGFKRAVSAVSSEAKQDSVKSGQLRSKRNLRRLVQSNVYQWYEQGRVYNPMFLTLTFKQNITDLVVANNAFMKFVQRMNRKIFEPIGQKMAYVAVVEFQKRGAVHYHMIVFNLPFIADRVYNTLLKIWRQNNDDGAIYLEKVGSVKGAVRYISKYLVKNFTDDRLFNKKRFFCSRNLLRPVVINDDLAALTLVDIVKFNLEFAFNCGSFPLTGEINYYRFGLPGYVMVI